jgi:hypothetical protein
VRVLVAAVDPRKRRALRQQELLRAAHHFVDVETYESDTAGGKTRTTTKTMKTTTTTTAQRRRRWR